MKKYLLNLLVGALLISPLFVSAQSSLSSADLQRQIDNLMKQIQALQEQLAKKMAEQQAVPPAFCYDFNQDLSYGSDNQDVVNLNIALEKLGLYGNHTEEIKSFFSEKTASAVVAFQEKYKNEILKPSGLKNGTGYVGPATRAKLNKLYGCGMNTLPVESWITILSPNGGETLPFGKLIVNWTATGLGGKVLVYLQFPDGALCKIGSSEAKKGTDSFNVVEGDKCDSNRSMVVGQYKVAIFSDKGKDSGRDYSDNFFNLNSGVITNPPGTASMTVLSPNGGEVFKTGNKYTIKWNSVNIPSTQDVRIELRYAQNDPTYPGGKNIEEWIVEKTPNSGSYEWKVPEVYGLGMDEAAFRVKVGEAATQQGYSDYSDSVFTIKLGDSNPNLTVTSPVAGTNYISELVTGSNFSNSQAIAIEWNPIYSTGDTVRFTLLRKGDKSFSRWINTYYSNDKKWIWSIPAELSGNDYFLRVEMHSTALPMGIGYSGLFSINSSTDVNSKLSVTASRLGEASGRSLKNPDDIASMTLTAGARKATIKSITFHFGGDALANGALPKSIRLIDDKGNNWGGSGSKSCISDGAKSCSVTFSFSNNPDVPANSSKVINLRIDSTKLSKAPNEFGDPSSMAVFIGTDTDFTYSEGGVEMYYGKIYFPILGY